MIHAGTIVCLLGFAGFVAMAQVVPPAQAKPAAAARPAGQFQPPRSPLLLTRTLKKVLPDGKQVITRRAYKVRIAPNDGRFRIDGELVDVAVEAPGRLRALAEIERKRPDTGMFPMWLDSAGMLLRGSEPQSGKSTGEAADLVAGEIGEMDLPRQSRQQALAFVSQFRERPGLTQWPADLFRPVPGVRREARTIALPDGTQGRATIDLEANANAATGLLVSFSRTVTTEIDGESRVTHEIWTLGKAH